MVRHAVGVVMQSMPTWLVIALIALGWLALGAAAAFIMTGWFRYMRECDERDQSVDIR